MASHNAAPYIEQAIKSVTNQTFTDLELIIVDDASQDDSLLLSRKAALNDPRLKVLSLTKNVGAGAARNIAIEEAHGEWLAILDADDVFLPNKLQQQVELIQEANSNTVLVGAGCFHIDAAGQRSKQYEYAMQSKTLKKNLQSGRKFPPHSSLIYRTSAISKVGGYNQRFLRAQDYELCLRLSEVGDFACCRSPLVEYRIHSSNISHQISNQGFTQAEYGIAAKVCQMLRRNNRIDPSTAADQELWHVFMLHVARIVRQSNYQKYDKWKQNWKQKLKKSHNFFDKLACSAGPISESPFFIINLLGTHTRLTVLAEQCFETWDTDNLCVD